MFCKLTCHACCVYSVLFGMVGLGGWGLLSCSLYSGHMGYGAKDHQDIAE
jgi:hypothetical protein